MTVDFFVFNLGFVFYSDFKDVFLYKHFLEHLVIQIAEKYLSSKPIWRWRTKK